MSKYLFFLVVIVVFSSGCGVKETAKEKDKYASQDHQERVIQLPEEITQKYVYQEVRAGNTEVVKALLAREPRFATVELAAEAIEWSENPEVLKIILDRGHFNVNTPIGDPWDYTRKREIRNYFLDNEGIPRINTTELTLIRLYAESSNIKEMGEILLEYGADPEDCLYVSDKYSGENNKYYIVYDVIMQNPEIRDRLRRLLNIERLNAQKKFYYKK